MHVKSSPIYKASIYLLYHYVPTDRSVKIWEQGHNLCTARILKRKYVIPLGHGGIVQRS